MEATINSITLGKKAAEATVSLSAYIIFTGQIFILDSAVVKHKIC